MNNFSFVSHDFSYGLSNCDIHQVEEYSPSTQHLTFNELKLNISNPTQLMIDGIETFTTTIVWSLNNAP